MKVRSVILEDAGELAHLYSELAPDDPEPPMDQFEKKLRKIIASEHLQIYVLEFENQVVATCYLNVIDNLTRALSPYALIENVVTRSEYRGRGFGKQVIKYALARSWDVGCYKVMLLTGSNREATLRFYESCGFNRDEKTAFVARPSQHDVPFEIDKKHKEKFYDHHNTATQI